LGAVGLVWVTHASRPPAATTVVLAAVAFVVERRRIAVGAGVSVSASYLPIVLAVVVAGPVAGMVVSSTSLLAHLTRPYLRWFVWTCSGVASASIAGTAVRLVIGLPRSISHLVAAALIAGAVGVAVNLTLATFTVAIRRGPWRQTLVAGWTVVVSAVAVYVPMVAAFAYAYSRIGVWAIGVMFPPLIAAQQLLVMYRQQRETALRLSDALQTTEATNRQLEIANEELAAKNDELEDANVSFAISLIVSLDARDHYTAGHSAAVAVYSRDIAAAIGLSPDEQRRAYLAGLMHDVGKVGLPPGILEKVDVLSDDEQIAMQQHVLIGERILAPVRQFHDLAPAVRHHHERYDGRGYPDRLVGDEIPLLARIIAVGDTYNAMTSNRPYRGAMEPQIAIDALLAVAGEQLDPELAPALARILRRADAAYRVARRSEFMIEFARLGELSSRPEILRN
jgi:HD-GYP domain-containing protein (c-di-GMP phosphodiesterase class II)